MLDGIVPATATVETAKNEQLVPPLDALVDGRSDVECTARVTVSGGGGVQVEGDLASFAGGAAELAEEIDDLLGDDWNANMNEAGDLVTWTSPSSSSFVQAQVVEPRGTLVLVTKE